MLVQNCSGQSSGQEQYKISEYLTTLMRRD
jgi:hypothetical protein